MRRRGRALRRRYGRATPPYDSLAYRGYEYRVRHVSAPLRGGRSHLNPGRFEADVLKHTINGGVFTEATVKGASRKEVISKAKAVIDAMRGD